MFSLIPLPYKLLGTAILAALIFLSGVTGGYKWHKAKTDAAMIAAITEANQRFFAEVERGDALSDRLAQAESATQTQTIEVIKYVPKVTTGAPCLSAGAVGLLNGTGYPVKPLPSAGQPAAEATAPLAASDRDVAYWIADANRRYDTCAERLNTLIDFELGSPQ